MFLYCKKTYNNFLSPELQKHIQNFNYCILHEADNIHNYLVYNKDIQKLQLIKYDPQSCSVISCEVIDCDLNNQDILNIFHNAKNEHINTNN